MLGPNISESLLHDPVLPCTCIYTYTAGLPDVQPGSCACCRQWAVREATVAVSFCIAPVRAWVAVNLALFYPAWLVYKAVPSFKTLVNGAVTYIKALTFPIRTSVSMIRAVLRCVHQQCTRRNPKPGKKQTGRKSNKKARPTNYTKDMRTVHGRVSINADAHM